MIDSAAVRAKALEMGFASVGIAAAEPSDHADFYQDWIASGRHGEMAYLARPDAIERRADPEMTLPGAASVIVVADRYGSEPTPGAEAEDVDPSRAIIARYARGRDYHEVMGERLVALLDWIQASAPGAAGRWYVDTGPVLEREWARRAGLGWFGKNTMLIDPRRGSYLLLGVVLVDLPLAPSEPFEEDRCGSCRACIDACPTEALLGRDESGAPVIDARRCISYLTIELKGAIPEELRPAIGNRVFGCDICQEVCPWTVKFGAEDEASTAYEAAAWPPDETAAPPLPSLSAPDLVDLTERILAMSGKAYQRVFAASPLARPGRKRMLRNLCVALGNYGAGSPEAADRVRPVLERAAEDASDLVREHARWALNQSR